MTMESMKYSLKKAGLDEQAIYTVLSCKEKEEQIRLLRKYRFQVLDEVHQKQQALDGIDYLIYQLKNEQ